MNGFLISGKEIERTLERWKYGGFLEKNMPMVSVAKFIRGLRLLGILFFPEKLASKVSEGLPLEGEEHKKIIEVADEVLSSFVKTIKQKSGKEISKRQVCSRVAGHCGLFPPHLLREYTI
ncbi:MAG: hypothetical protein PHC85_00235 [Candidatus Pacebacteria bacterium]|nr:hypothetical protein [Candidatus Paceibacterota bacterium]